MKSSLQIEPARDGGYVVKEVGVTTPAWKTLFAGSLEKAVEYVRGYYFVPAEPPKHGWHMVDGNWLAKYEDQNDPFSKKA